MNHELVDTPIKRKLTLVILLTCSVVLLLACGVLAAYQMFDFRQNHGAVTRRSWPMSWPKHPGRAGLSGRNAAPQTLSRSGSRTQCVSGLPLRRTMASIFARLCRPRRQRSVSPQPGMDGHRFRARSSGAFPSGDAQRETHRHHLSCRPICRGLYDRLRLFGVASPRWFCWVRFSWPLPSRARCNAPFPRPSWPWRKPPSAIAEHKDYTVRVPSRAANETGLLTDAFNQLLASIEERDKALRTANESLRQEIAERKGAETESRRNWPGWSCSTRSPAPSASGRICRASFRSWFARWKTVCRLISAASAFTTQSANA